MSRGRGGGGGGGRGRELTPPAVSPAAGAPELHTHHLIPSLRQVVFQGDRLPFQCTATYLDNSTQIRWFHNREPVEEDERTGVIVEESLIHDCTFITRSGRGDGDGNGGGGGDGGGDGDGDKMGTGMEMGTVAEVGMGAVMETRWGR